ncbi:molybdenum cofactor guanylyltransferase [Rosettibacter firmus]|uniref:molybdenum cofactor guanylyltransferase n=1 Tax=Rosettibacter firmus TaxID=3111522 RepID=UPI00336BF76F
MYSIVGVILSGGQSERMGSKKALLKFDDKTLIEIIYERIKSIFDKIVISTNNPEDFEFLSLDKIKDIYPNLGPLSGVHSSLSQVESDRVFIMSCDTPFITTSLINHLLNVKTDEFIIVPKAEGVVHHSIGIYSKEILPLAEKILSANYVAKKIYEEKKPFYFSMRNFIERAGAEIVDVEKEKFYFHDLFFNMNTPEDYEYVKEKLF